MSHSLARPATLSPTSHASSPSPTPRSAPPSPPFPSRAPRLAPWIRSKPALLKALQPIAQVYAHACGYRQLGMRYDDLLQPWSNEVQTAIGRLSENEGYDRQYRIRPSPSAWPSLLSSLLCAGRPG